MFEREQRASMKLYEHWSKRAIASEWIYCLLSENNKLMQSHFNLFVHMLHAVCLYVYKYIRKYMCVSFSDM